MTLPDGARQRIREKLEAWRATVTLPADALTVRASLDPLCRELYALYGPDVFHEVARIAAEVLTPGQPGPRLKRPMNPELRQVLREQNDEALQWAARRRGRR